MEMPQKNIFYDLLYGDTNEDSNQDSIRDTIQDSNNVANEDSIENTFEDSNEDIVQDTMKDINQKAIRDANQDINKDINKDTNKNIKHKLINPNKKISNSNSVVRLQEKIKEEHRQIRQARDYIKYNEDTISDLKEYIKNQQKQVIKSKNDMTSTRKLNKKIRQAKDSIKYRKNENKELIEHIMAIEKRIQIDTEILNEYYGFDDELYELGQTVDILCTDPNHVPQENHFHETVRSNLYTKDTKYNPDVEREKYSYDKILKVRYKRVNHNG